MKKVQWKRVTWYSQIAAIVIFVGVFFLGIYLGMNMGLQIQRVQGNPVKHATIDPANATYMILGKKVTLENGEATSSIASSSAKVITKLATSALWDVNDDGRKDAVAILTQSTGGSGTFYYLDVSLSYAGRFIPTKSFLLGDRVALLPRALFLSPSRSIFVHYKVHTENEPMALPPSKEMTKVFRLSSSNQSHDTHFASARRIYQLDDITGGALGD